MATPNLALIPTGYKAGKVYSVLPTPSYGTELITNGDFQTDSDWTKGTGWSIGGGVASCVSDNNNLSQNVGVTANKNYKVTFDVSAYTSGTLSIDIGSSSSQTTASSGSKTFYFTTTSTNDLRFYGGAFRGSIDNVSVKEVLVGSGDFDFTRASAATRTNSNGLLKVEATGVPRLEYPLINGVVNGCPSLLLEPQATNLITYPISFGNSYWTKSGASIEGDPSTAGSELVTNGDFTTDTVWTKGTGWTIGSGVASSDGTQAGTSALYQDCGIVLGKQYQVVYDVTSYTAGSVRIYLGGTSTGAVSRSATGTYTQQFSALGNQWVTFEADVNFIGSIDNVSVKEVQGYSSPSVDFPTSAFKLVEGTSTGTHVLEKNLGAPSGASFTWSIYAKKGEKDWIVINAYNGGSARVWFDLANGVLGTESGDAVGTIEEVSGGWYKCSVTRPSNTIVIFSLGLAEANNIFSYTGDGTSGVYLFMAQLETGSVATSPTLTSLSAEGTTTTRVAETCNGAGDASTFNDSEGVLMVEGSFSSNTSSTNQRIAISDGTTSNRILIQNVGSTSNRLQFYVIVGGVVSTDVNLDINDITTLNKIVFKYKENDFSVWINGFEVLTDTSGITFPNGTLTELAFDGGDGSNDFYGKTKQIQYFNTVLTSAELETLTSWTSFISMANALNYNII